MRVKMTKQPPPAPTVSAVGPCPTVIQIVGRPGTGSLPSTIAPPDHPPPPVEQELPDLYPSCAVTRAMAKKAMLTKNQSDVDLTYSFIGQSFKNEINKSLSYDLPEHQTDSNDCKSESDYSPSSLVEDNHDIRSRSLLSKKRHKDPDISPLFKNSGQCNRSGTGSYLFLH